MKSIKKFLAVILSMTLMLTLGTAAFGAQKTLPSGKDTGSINVTNLKPGDTVTAYQFVKADYNEYGFTGYSAINNYVKDPVAPTAQEVIDMASNAATMTVAAEKKVATGDTEVTLNGLPVGYYLVMVTSGSETVYSPMIAGIYYSKSATDNTLTNGAISADSDFEIKAQKCWAKSSTPKLEKTIVTPSSKNSKGDDIAIGDKITFNLSATVPSYSKEYKKVTYKIYDIMSEGLDYVDGSMKCFIEKYENNRENIKVTPKVNGGIIEITFDSKFILEHPGQKIQVEYQAKLNNIRLMDSDDISKIILICDDGKYLYDRLLDEYKVQLEMASFKYVIAMTSVADKQEYYDRFLSALKEIDESWKVESKDSENDVGESLGYAINNKPEVCMCPADAIDLMDENGYEDLSVNSPDICGRISMSSVLIYPPGMPVVNVGERITGDVCRIIKSAINAGLEVPGLKEGKIRCLR